MKYTDPSGYDARRLWEIEMNDRDAYGEGAQFSNNYVNYWGQVQDAYENMHTYEESENRKKQENKDNESKSTKGSENQIQVFWLPGVPYPLPLPLSGIMSVSVTGTISAGLIGISIDLGVIIDLKDGVKFSPYISVGSAIGADASLGPQISYFESKNGESLTTNDLKGWSESYNIGIWIFDGSNGGNSENPGLRITSYSDSHNKYKYMGIGVSPISTPIGFTRRKTYTWFLFK